MDKRLRKNSIGYWEVRDRPTTQELQMYYADKYYQEALGSYELEYSKDELANINNKVNHRANVLKAHLPIKTRVGSLLDVGCGEGFTLDFFRRMGWTIKGMDFSSAGIKSKNPNCLDALVTGDVFELLASEVQSGKKYDVVWVQNVLEHVLEPKDLLETLRLLVASDGLAVVTVPNDCSITQGELLKLGHIEHCFWVCPPEHLSYFDHESLRSISESTGWSVAEIQADFPVDWFLFNPASNYVSNKDTGKLAYKAKIQIENLISGGNKVDAILFYSALARLGLGRNITAYLKPNPIKTTE